MSASFDQPSSGKYGLHVLVLVKDSEDYAMVAAEQLNASLDHCDVQIVFGLEGALEAAEQTCPETTNCLVPTIILSARLGNVDNNIERLSAHEQFANSGFVLLTDQRTHSDTWKAIHSGKLVSIIACPWTAPTLIEQVDASVDRWLLKWMPNAEITHALQADGVYDAPRGGDLLYGLDSPGEQMQQFLLQGIEKILGPRPRMIVPEGVDLTKQGESVDGVYLVLRGSVALHRSSQFGDVLLHHATSGPLIGLISLARQQRALFTSTTTTEAEIVRLSLEQLEFVLQQSPDTSANLAVVAIQALTQRLVRAEYLHIEKNELAEQLERERETLQKTLEELRATREQLVEKTKYAMLGELSAGIAHELNNPVAALQRASQQIGDDLDTILAATAELADAQGTLKRALNAPPRSTAEERRLVRQVMKQTKGDRDMAKRLVAAEITDSIGIKALLKKDRSYRRRHPLRPEHSPMRVVEAAAHIGRSVKNSNVAARRIVDLVSSLKAYARPDSAPIGDINVHENIEDTLRLTAHRLRSVEIERAYGDIPLIRCYPARLEQVWTNLLVNASEAIEAEDEKLAEQADPTSTDAIVLPARGHAKPTIRVETSQPDPEHIRVTVIDNGPGIAADNIEHIIEPHFTTKGGQVRYGLGMGMSITHSIVDDHDGVLTIESEPGRTAISVTLPVAGPKEDETDAGDNPVP